MRSAVRSAGTGAATGAAASPEAVDVAGERGVDLSTHASQPLTPELLDWADLVLVMGPAHLQVVAELGAAEKVAYITDFLEHDPGQAVTDPFGGDHESYRATYAQLEDAVGALLDRLEPILAP